MTRALLVSFDLVREGEPSVSLSSASLIAAARQAASRGAPLQLDHRSFNLLGARVTAEEVVGALASEFPLRELDAIALAAYVWGEYLLPDVLRLLRREVGFRGTIVLGGPQISYGEDAQLYAAYPEADVFVKGYAEACLPDALAAGRDGGRPRVLSQVPDFASLPSPYLSGVLPVRYGQERVRLETKRGCPYRCSFCAHRDLQQNRVYRHEGEKTLRELELLAAADVGKVNVLDPVFNVGKEYLPLLRALADRHFAPTLSLQCRMENVKDGPGEEFLSVCGELDVVLEFGLQSIHEQELGAVQRRHQLRHVEDTLRALNQRGIAYEVSLIYGLPNQTIRTFETTLAFLRDAGCAVVKAFPLMLLRGTELFDQRDHYGFVERPMGEFGIPTVVSSRSFDAAEWEAMRELADGLVPAERV